MLAPGNRREAHGSRGDLLGHEIASLAVTASLIVSDITHTQDRVHLCCYLGWKAFQSDTALWFDILI